MDEQDLLVWDITGVGRIQSQGVKFITHEKFDIPEVEYDQLFYEPDVNNYFKVLDNQQIPLTDEEKEAVGKYIFEYKDVADYPVWAYDGSYLYINEMMKSKAEELGVDYTLLAGRPDHLASKFVPATPTTPEHWERIKLVLRDNGSFALDPAQLCDRCIEGYTEEEYKSIPHPEHYYDRWNFHAQKWYDPRKTDDLKYQAWRDIQTAFDILLWKEIGDYTPQYQMDTWVWQVEEAKKLLVYKEEHPGATSTNEDLFELAPYLYTFYTERTDDEKPDTIFDLAKDVLDNHEKYLIAAAKVNAELWKYKKLLNKTQDNKEIDAISTEVKEKADPRMFPGVVR